MVEDCEIVSDKGADLRYSTGVVLKNVNITQADSLGYSLANCKNVVMQNCRDASGDVVENVFQYKSENVVIE